ncbi:inositol-phosphate phosphatase [Corynebacterium pollutisoli]|uniref:Histidinol-phosphatase n=1 Tax=Corynebacterium pollutisoli TaxID=1610489 RepID=A0A1X7JEI0_9CORY|nr:histidinol-phosphatase [Corynebacterium pollutisoli]SMG25865.1 inositol-phosphate phosphatase [Corynebacterium pollutisoli]HJD79232.1 histidinol-phosphatase [Corynebacterium pollutisoli]
MTSYADDLALALELADLADSLTLERFEATDLNVTAKPDMSPVSDADLACEEALRAKLAEARPSDSILGEEFGGEATHEGRQWVIDPIDGTKNFVRGVPVWATLISLLVDGEPVVGVISAPALARRWYAAAESGAWRSFNSGSPKKLSVSGVESLTDASLSFSSLEGWAERGLRENFIALSDETWRLRGYGDFFSYCLVAEGAVDIAAEPEVSLWDLAALSVLVTEAGGRFTSLAGEDGPHGGDAIATNGLLHDAALGAIRG